MVGTATNSGVKNMVGLCVTPRGVIMDAVMYEVRSACSSGNDLPGWDELVEAAVEALEQVSSDPGVSEHLAIQAKSVLLDKGTGDKLVPWQNDFIPEFEDVVDKLIGADEIVPLHGGVYTLGPYGFMPTPIPAQPIKQPSNASASPSKS
jgi:hypothetical protein